VAINSIVPFGFKDNALSEGYIAAMVLRQA
jgi:hypothetical protein